MCFRVRHSSYFCHFCCLHAASMPLSSGHFLPCFSWAICLESPSLAGLPIVSRVQKSLLLLSSAWLSALLHSLSRRRSSSLCSARSSWGCLPKAQSRSSRLWLLSHQIITDNSKNHLQSAGLLDRSR